MEVDNKYKLWMLIILIACLDVAVGHVTFEAVVNNEKPVNLTHRFAFEDVKTGDNLTLFCHVDGVPAQLVRGGATLSNPFTMHVNTCGHLGFFTCIPRDAIYLGKNTLHVAFNSKCTPLTFDLSPILAREGDNVKVTCTADTSPGAHFRIIKEDTRRVISISPIYIDNDIHELTSKLEHVTCKDEGTYTCQVVTQFEDVSEKKAELQIHGCPTMFMKINVTGIQTEEYSLHYAKITCTIEDYPTSVMTISREDTRKVLNSSQSNTALGHAEVTFDLKEFTCDDMRTYICQATGQDGKVHNRTGELSKNGCPPMLCWNETGTVDIVVGVNQSTTVPVCLRFVAPRISVDALYQGARVPYEIHGLNEIYFDRIKNSGIYHNIMIQFKNIQEYDYGQWLFLVGNRWGVLNVTINLRPDEKTKVQSVSEKKYDANTTIRGHSDEKKDDHSGVSTKMIGMGAGLAISALLIIILSLLIIARWCKSKSCSTTNGKGHLDPVVDSKYSIYYKRIYADTQDEGQSTMNDDSNVQNRSRVNLLGGKVTCTAEETVTIQGS